MSPRSALLSQTPLQPPAKPPSASIQSDRRSSANGAVEKRRDTRSRNSRDRRKRATLNVAGSTDFPLTRLSKLELDRLRSDPQTEAVELRELLEAAVRQVQVESKRAAELERANQENAMRFRMLNENRVAAQQEAAKANSDVKLYQAQLDNAHKDLDRAKLALQEVERQRDDAEAAAARAREKARKLHQDRLIAAAKEEGRRLGFEAGFDHAKQEREMLAARRPPRIISAPHPNPKGKERERYSEDESPRRTSHGGHSPDDDIETSPSEELSPTQLPIRGLPLDPPARAHAGPSTATPPRPFQPPPSTNDVESQRQLSPPPEPQHSSRPYHLLKTPSVQVWPIDIPAPDQVDQSYNSHENPNDPIPRRPRDEWVTANKHQQMRNRPPRHSHSTLRNQTSRPSSAGPPPPQPIFPVAQPSPVASSSGPTPIPSRPPLGPSNKSVRFPTWVRRPSLAKTKQQASSWYRRLSFRRKQKPVIDPILEESETPKSSTTTIPLSAPLPQTASTGPPDSGRSAENVYGSAIQPPASWYHYKRASVASTRVSQFDLLATPAAGIIGPSQDGNREKPPAVKEKESLLSVIRESRAQTPSNVGSVMSGPNGRVSMASMRQPGPANKQALQHQASYETDNRSRRSRRPKSIVVPDPAALLLPPGASYSQQSLNVPAYGSNLGHKPSIEIDVVPPSAYAPQNAQSPPHTGRNHLSPYHVFKPAPPMQSFPSAVYDAAAMPNRPPSAAPSRRSNHSRSASADMYGNPLSPSRSPPLQPPRPPFAYGSSGSASGKPDSVRSGPSRHVPRNASQSSFKLHNPDPPSESSSSSPDPYPHSPQQQPRLHQIVAPSGGQEAGLVLAPPVHRSKSNNSMKSQGSYSKYDPHEYVDPAFWGVDGPDGPPAATPARPKPGMLVDEDPRRSRRASVNSGLSYA
ncbi:hypothetical protein CPB83DRAFT_862209 [Crepidotus variabilis]|uniref:Uncharacterized protein n=1 Tax=Crepidotus variabilis TaxID=179855 RepID=A0A9P6E7E3_9AGAR|nr:hypothetical protein CPB83DRAFT_862209 [Crepidotus variabilis]